MFNSIVLLHGEARLTKNEYKKFNQYDTINGADSDPITLKIWKIEEEEKALEELKKYRCEYKAYNEQLIDVSEYALEYCELDDDLEFIDGSNYEFAEGTKGI